MSTNNNPWVFYCKVEFKAFTGTLVFPRIYQKNLGHQKLEIFLSSNYLNVQQKISRLPCPTSPSPFELEIKAKHPQFSKMKTKPKPSRI